MTKVIHKLCHVWWSKATKSDTFGSRASQGGSPTSFDAGFTLIQALTAIILIVVAGFGIYTAFDFSLKILWENKARATAISLTEEKMELIRNLTYNDVGTLGGVPPGIIPQNETVERNGIPFLVNTQIFYIDDPFDGVQGGNPDDSLNTDYKRVRITTSWLGIIYGEPATLISYVAPRGLESAVGGGTLKILVFNASGLVVPQADVNIENTAVEPDIFISSQTGLDGQLLVPGAAASQEGYQIIVTKTNTEDDYSLDKTYPSSVDFPSPVKPQASVIENEVTEISFAIDVLGTINIATLKRDYPVNFKINTAASTNDQTGPQITIDNSNFYYFVWEDYRDGAQPRIYAQKYDANQTNQWLTDKQISTAVNQANPEVVSDGINIFIAWNDTRNGNQDVYLAKLDPAGNNLWGGDKKIDVSQNSADQINPALAYSTSTSEIIVVFQDNRNTNWDIYAQKYDTNGDTVWASEIKINTDVSNRDQLSPEIILDTNNNFYVIWNDFRNGVVWDIYAQKYDLGGNKIWVSDVKINTSSGSDSLNPDIVFDPQGFIYLVWQDERNGNWDIYLGKYNLDGVAEWIEDKIVNTEIDNSNQTDPAITRDSSGNIYISWTDNRNGHEDIYAQKFDINGQKLWTNDERINLDLTTSDQGSSDIIIDTDGKVVFVWEDERGENYDIYAAQYSGPSDPVPVGSVPLNVRGAKLIYNDPLIYKFDNNYTTDSNGNLALPNMEWDSYIITTQATSSYTLISSEPVQPINLEPRQTVDVVLNIE